MPPLLRKPGFLIGAFSLGAIVLLAGIKIAQKMRGPEALPVAAYAANPPALVGNTYGLRASIVKLLGNNEHGDRIFEVQPVDEALPVPVLVPGSIAQNILGEQRYFFIVNIHDGGTLYVQQMDKY